MDETTVATLVDEAAMRRLIAAFYRRVREDDRIGPLYPPDDWEAAEERLAGFLCFRIHGNMDYIERRGHPRLRMRHAGFRIGVAERDRWLALMRASMEETAVPAGAAEWLDKFFAQVADFMRNTPED